MKTLSQSSILEASTQPVQLTDPLSKFDWSSLYDEYDALCRGFKPSAPYLASISPSSVSDRELYWVLMKRFAGELKSADGVSFETYLGMLYWKLYSRGAAVANTCKFLIENARARENATIGLRKLSSHLREVSTKEPQEITELLQDHGKYCFRGMEYKTALPVRTTFLHFARPAEVSIFDNKVLHAVGVVEKYANEKFRYLQAYLPHARRLATKHAQSFSNLYPEGPLRLIDMALWIVGHNGNGVSRKCTR